MPSPLLKGTPTDGAGPGLIACASQAMVVSWDIGQMIRDSPIWRAIVGSGKGHGATRRGPAYERLLKRLKNCGTLMV